MSNILLLEDDSVLSKEIKLFLTNNGFTCDCVYDGNRALAQARLNEYALALLDINVCGINGLEVCKALRAADNKLPILMLTAFSEVEDKLAAFNNGADDYLIKPFHFDELMARVKSLLRRSSIPQCKEDRLKVADLIMDNNHMKVFRNHTEINLSPKEFKLLKILIQSNGRILSKAQIAQQLWEYQVDTNQNTIEVYINFLRKKIDKDADIKLIHTKVGFGYYLKEE